MAVVLICGAPASGKSSITKSLECAEVIVLNRDSVGGSVNDLLPKYEQHLKDKADIVLDNLFTTKQSRKPFIDLAAKYNTSIVCKLMDTSIEDCQFNAVQRAINIIGCFPSPEEIKKAKHPNIFPPAVLFKYRKEFEKPSLDEGFNKIEVIKFERKDDPSYVNKALFLDYDGCIRECIGGNGKFPVTEDQIQIKPNVLKTLQAYKEKGYRLIGVSNQSGVAKGDLTYDKCVQLFEHTNKLLGIDIEYNFCPHQSAPISCYCRKPMCGTFVKFMLKYKLNRKECLMVGDLKTDETFSKRAGIKYIDQKDFYK